MTYSLRLYLFLDMIENHTILSIGLFLYKGYQDSIALLLLFKDISIHIFFYIDR